MFEEEEFDEAGYTAQERAEAIGREESRAEQRAKIAKRKKLSHDDPRLDEEDPST